MRLTELHLAISFKNLGQVKFLMKNGLLLDRMWRGDMPVSRAVYYEAYEILEYLVQKGAEVNVLSQSHRMEPPLFAACSLGRLKAVRILLQSPNLDIDQRDFFDRTPLWAAVRSRSLEMVKLLLDHGADVAAAKNFTSCPLLLTMPSLGRNPHCEIPYLLIKRGCLLDIRGPRGSALTFSVIFENRKLFCLLINAGCTVENEELLNMDKLPLSWKNDINFCQWICSLHNNPRSLVHLTSCMIRKSLAKIHKNIFPAHITQLPLPEVLKRCLLLEN
ncbi:Alpha-latrocrustotoxin-Lt1a-like protein [Argiope bruennichi]|uniref:Alpha-latrocrustotoxin-Lt1a-like protein n=1 Tax=Argiope bruennichi TaxID=94029 RepID=A0A8T0E6T6_ARGBR|nr:Alpha-latrocrustotoxin-Lt1a-like protein [Argiope bruennichi]